MAQRAGCTAVISHRSGGPRTRRSRTSSSTSHRPDQDRLDEPIRTIGSTTAPADRRRSRRRGRVRGCRASRRSVADASISRTSSPAGGRPTRLRRVLPRARRLAEPDVARWPSGSATISSRIPRTRCTKWPPARHTDIGDRCRGGRARCVVAAGVEHRFGRNQRGSRGARLLVAGSPQQRAALTGGEARSASSARPRSSRGVVRRPTRGWRGSRPPWPCRPRAWPIVALPAQLRRLAAATFLRCAVLLAVVRFFAAVGVVASAASSSRWAAFTFAISRLLRRAALFGCRMPFSAALSSALMAAATASGPLPSARPSAMSEACRTSVFASLRVRRFTARRRSDWRTRLSAEGVARPSSSGFLPRGILVWGQ